MSPDTSPTCTFSLPCVLTDVSIPRGRSQFGTQFDIEAAAQREFQAFQAAADREPRSLGVRSRVIDSTFASATL